MDFERKPTGFLQLPKEVRLMIYEQIPFTTRYCTWNDVCNSEFDRNQNDWLYPRSRDGVGPHPCGRSEHSMGSVILVMKFMSTTILCTCREVQREALNIIAAKLAQLRQVKLRFIVDVRAFTAFAYDDHMMLQYLNECIQELSNTGKIETKPDFGLRHAIGLRQVDLVWNPSGHNSLCKFLYDASYYIHARAGHSTGFEIALNETQRSYPQDKIFRDFSRICREYEPWDHPSGVPLSYIPGPVGVMIRTVNARRDNVTYHEMDLFHTIINTYTGSDEQICQQIAAQQQPLFQWVRYASEEQWTQDWVENLGGSLEAN